MGFCQDPRRTGHPPVDPSPAVTPREYISLLSNAITNVLQAPPRRVDGYERGVAHLASGRFNAAVRAFDSFVCLHPNDPVGHRMLGLAHLAAGHFVVGARHLVFALKILRRDVRAPVPLPESLRLQLEAALARLLLLPLCGRLGHRDAVNRLMLESLAL